jgi:hypothetical protein
MMRRGITSLLVFLVLLALPFAVRWFSNYRLTKPERQPVPAFDPVEVVARVPTPAAGDYFDEPEVGQGLILLDRAHSNQFRLAEISSLDRRLAARGFELVPFEGGSLASALRPVSAFVVIAPLVPFTVEEIQDVKAFAGRGGRVLLVGDPTRFNLGFSESAFSFNYVVEDDQIPLNSLANQFDLAFNGDYLYNTLDNEGNFRNIILKPDGDGAPDLLAGVEQLVFYGSHSIQTGTTARPLLVGDDHTWSSATDRPGGLALAALSADDRVLAVGDIDFLSEPYATVFDNGRFIVQIADFLTQPQRGYVLADFPYFYGDVVDLVFSDNPRLGPDAFDEIIALQNAFRRAGKELMLVDDPRDGHDVLYLGLYNQADEVADLLEAAGIMLVVESTAAPDTNGDSAESGNSRAAGDGQIESILGSVQMAGTAIIVLQEEQNRPNLVVLAASGDGLESAIRRLIDFIPMDADYALTDCLLQEAMAFCPTNVAGEPVEAVLDTSGQPDEIEPDGDEETGTEDVDLAAVLQGAIALGETVEATMAENEAHSWTFSQGPALVDIVLESGEDMDGILELYDPEGFLMAAVDSSFTGEEERLAGIPIPDDGEYTIVVRDFYEDGGSYALRVTTAGPQDIDAVDQGELPVDQPVEGLLGEGEAHSYTFAVDGSSTVTIVLQSGSDIDGILALFDPENNLVAFVDDTLDGGEERLDDFALTDEGIYTVVVGDFFNDGGAYTLLLESVVPALASGRATGRPYISVGAMMDRPRLERAVKR